MSIVGSGMSAVKAANVTLTRVRQTAEAEVAAGLAADAEPMWMRPRRRECGIAVAAGSGCSGGGPSWLPSRRPVLGVKARLEWSDAAEFEHNGVGVRVVVYPSARVGPVVRFRRGRCGGRRRVTRR